MTTQGSVEIADTAVIAPTAIIGQPFRPLLDGRHMVVTADTFIDSRVWVGDYVVIGQGVRIGNDSIIENYAEIQAGTELGAGVLVTSRARIGGYAKISDGSVIKGHVDDHVKVGVGCRIAGDLIHRQLDPSVPWDDPGAEEPAPVVHDGAFVGWNAVVVGGVNIGAGAYVCAGALITKDVPAGQIAYGRNRLSSPANWPGALGKSPFFERNASRSTAMFRFGRHT
jgi:bifunctional N-acetylglucosamine-1-phosphate-uridyltransferase/glucosamine-1-phosphate-acetyltransferase GlmU-like protein